MIFMLLGVAAVVKTTCRVLDFVHELAETKRKKRHVEEQASKIHEAMEELKDEEVAAGAERPEELFLQEPAPRIYASHEEYAACRGVGVKDPEETRTATRKAETRFQKKKHVFEHCMLCEHLITDPLTYHDRKEKMAA